MKSDKGITLAEVLLAAAILAFAIAGLLAAFINCVLLVESNKNLVTAVNDAQYVLEQTKSLPYNELSTYAPPVFNNLDNETITLIRSIGTKISEVTVNVNWSERQKNRSFQLSTRIAR